MYFVNSAGLNLSALLNPTTRANYSVDTFRRILNQIDDSITVKRYSEYENMIGEMLEDTRNLQANLTPTITVTSPNGVYFTTMGWTTLTYGAQNNSGLNPTLTLAQYTFAGSAKLCASFTLMMIAGLMLLLK